MIFLASTLGYGLRRAEVCGLTLTDVNFQESAITLTRYLLKVTMNLLLVWIDFRKLDESPAFTSIFRGGHILKETSFWDSAVTRILKEWLAITAQKTASRLL